MSGEKILTVYYSDTGHTKHVADEIAARLSTVLERIVAPGLRRGVWGALQRNWTAGFGRPVTIGAIGVRPGDFDLVIVGSPLWSGHASSPVRTWLKQHRPALTQAAFFLTSGRQSPGQGFDEMLSASGRNPVACLHVTDDDRSSGQDSGRIHDFIEAIETWAARDS